MKHYCGKYGANDNADPTNTCDDCQKVWESDASICAHCWKPVSNKAFFGVRNNSQHLTGKCAEKQTSIPARWFDRRTLAPRHVDVISAYWASSKEAEETARHVARPLRITYPSPAQRGQEIINKVRELDAEEEANIKLLAALERQNELLKQLAA